MYRNTEKNNNLVNKMRERKKNLKKKKNELIDRYVYDAFP